MPGKVSIYEEENGAWFNLPLKRVTLFATLKNSGPYEPRA
jgi:hypothetical protein